MEDEHGRTADRRVRGIFPALGLVGFETKGVRILSLEVNDEDACPEDLSGEFIDASEVRAAARKKRVHE